MIKKILYLLFFLSFIGFSVAECNTGCVFEELCYDYGEVVHIGQQYQYCDLDSDSFVAQKTSGICLNDFECANNYFCLGGSCTNDYNAFIDAYSFIDQNISGLCLASAGGFCSNESIANSSLIVNKTCDSSSFCYRCDSGYFYNDSLKLCITGICSSTPGCLSEGVNYSSYNSDYCSDSQKCYSCDADFEWNEDEEACTMLPCISSGRVAGCLDLTNLTHGYQVDNRSCDIGSCFSCSSGYAWNNTSSSCVLSATAGVVIWNTVTFSDSDLNLGTAKTLSINSKVPFSFAGLSYYFGLLSADTRIVFEIGIDSATSPTPLIRNQNLYVGDNRQFDLDDDGIYDFKVSLISVNSGSASISLQFVSEDYSDDENSDGGVDTSLDSSVDTQSDSETNLDLESSPANEGFIARNIWWFVVIGVIFLIALILLIIYLLNRKKDNKPTGLSGGSGSSSPSQPKPPVAPANAPSRPVGTPGMVPIGGYRPLPQRPMPSQNSR